jgi:2-methylcitrate dehydratase PrpD
MQTAVRPATAPDGPTGRLATWVHDLTLEQVPTEVQQRALHLLLDGVACALVGAQLPWSRIATQAVLELEGAGDAVVVGTGQTTSAPAAALLNSSFVQGFELDDFHPLAPLHSASLVLPAILSALDLLHRRGQSVTGRDVLLAAIAGFEVGPRIGTALHGTEMLNRGWHSGPVFGTHAAAMATGKLLGLDPAALEDALGYAATQSAGLMSAQYEAMGKRMQHGFAARNGFYGAVLAQAGYTGIDQVLEREYGGYLAVFGEGHAPDADAVTRGLGETWETNWIMVKSWAVMGGLHGVVQAARAVRPKIEADGIAATAIERIDIRVGSVVYHHGWWTPQRPLEAIGAQMNIGYAAAVALLDGTALPEQFTATRIDADDVWQLLDRTHVELDTAIDTLPLTERFQTHLTITLADGRAVEESVIAPHGNPLDPVTNAEVVDKYRALTARVIEPARMTSIESAVLNLPDLADLSGLLELLAAPVGRALDPEDEK